MASRTPQPPTPAAIAARLTVPERVLLFCVASGTDPVAAGIRGETVKLAIVKGLVERDAAARLALTKQGRAALGALLERS